MKTVTNEELIYGLKLAWAKLLRNLKSLPQMPDLDHRLFCEIGAGLFGVSWKEPLSQELGMSKRAVQRLANGQNEIKPGVWLDVADVCTARALKLNLWAHSIDVAMIDAKTSDARQ